ncbi:MAG: hypothetical protein D6690_05005 [Nitrospirae bacterium]|nr:MAG: hypothetical protein D6690_05005 [Nitrospirota bacterium]
MMPHKFPQTEQFHFSFVFLGILLVFQALPAWAEEPIDGFRGLKFGMTRAEVEALDFCSSSMECLYELVGKNRYIYPQYRRETARASNGSDTSAEQRERVSRIIIEFGRYTDDWYNDLRRMLGQAYQLTRDFDEATWNAFANEKIPEIVTSYAQGQVLLTVTRRKYGNLVIHVVYQDQTAAKQKRELEAAPVAVP